jgi:hypothetical protein
MEISKDIQELMELLEQFAEGKLRKQNDVATCFEICASYGGDEELGVLIFQGKILWNLSKKLRSTTQVDKGIELVQKEFESSLSKIKAVISEITDKLEGEDKERFEDVYLSLTKGSIMNIIDLSHDFAKFKDMQAEIQQNR